MVDSGYGQEDKSVTFLCEFIHVGRPEVYIICCPQLLSTYHLIKNVITFFMYVSLHAHMHVCIRVCARTYIHLWKTEANFPESTLSFYCMGSGYRTQVFLQAWQQELFLLSCLANPSP